MGIVGRQITDFTAARNNLYEGTKQAAAEIPPYETPTHVVRLADVDYDPNDNEDERPERFDYRAQKNAIYEKDTLGRRLRGTWQMVNKETGQVEQEQRRLLAVVPRVNDDGTVIYRGSRYSVQNQQRVKPAAFARLKKNEELETFVNVKPGTGSSHRYILNPETGVFLLNTGHSRVPLAPVLKLLGADDAKLQEAWGPELAKVNLEKRDKQALQKVYARLVPKKFQVKNPDEQMMQLALQETFKRMEVDPWSMKRTIGIETGKIDADTILAATKKVLQMNRGESDGDDRDHMAFQSYHTVEDLFPERIRLDKNRIQKQLIAKAIRRGGVSAIPPKALQPQIEAAIFSSGMAVQPELANPLDSFDRATRLTKMGEGGMSSTDSVPMESRDVHASQYGFVDPARTVESLRTGIDVNLASQTFRGEDGRLYTPVINARTGQREMKTPEDLLDANLAVSDRASGIPGLAEVTRRSGGGEDYAFPDEVDYVLPDFEQSAFSPLSNLIALKSAGAQNRLAMGARFIAQSLPLKNREAPLVQQSVPGTDRTISTNMAMADRVGAVFSKHEGVVTDVGPDGIKIKTAEGEKHIPVHNWTPLGSKTGLHNTPVVQVGSRVAPGQLLAKSNFTDDTGSLALGLNARVALMPWGDNYEDAITVSQSFAKRMTSEHLYRHRLSPLPEQRVKRNEFVSVLPSAYNKAQLEKLDDTGVIQVGQPVRKGDPLVLAATPKVSANLRKRQTKSFSDDSITWDHDDDGVVQEVHRARNGDVVVAVKSESSLRGSDKMCYDPETEVLTTRGWVRIADVTLEDRIATLVDGSRFEYLHPDAVHHYRHTGPMYRLQTTQVDLLVTDNHRLYVTSRLEKHRQKWSLRTAAEMYGTRYRMKRDGVWIGQSPAEVTFPGYTIDCGERNLTSGKQRATRQVLERRMSVKTFAMLLGAFLSEGNTFWQQKGGSFGLDISQTKPENRALMLKEFEEAGLSFCETANGLRMYSQQLAAYFRQFGLCHEKFIPLECFDWSIEDQRLLFSWMMWGDGHTKEGRSVNYTTVSRQLADDVQRLCLHIGYSANIHVQPAFEGWCNGKWSKFRDSYSVRIYTSKNQPTINHYRTGEQSAQTEEWVEYSGTVHCVSMPKGHVIYVRRNGKPVWCGNSDLYGAKGIVRIMPDEQMPHDEDGRPFDAVASDLGVISRQNPNRPHELLLGKIAAKRGQPYILDDFTGDDLDEFVEQELKKYDVKDRETIIDPRNGRRVKGVLTGVAHLLKLHHLSESKAHARGVGSYTADGTPSKGSDEDAQAKRLSNQELGALVAHGANSFIRESALLRGQNDPEFHARYMTGVDLPAMKVPFVYNKMLSYMKAAGVNPVKEGSKTSLMLMADKDVMDLAGSREVRSGETVDLNKDMKPVKGGLFDENIFGGDGNQWARYQLNEPIPHPLMEDVFRKLMGVTKDQYRNIYAGKQEFKEFGTGPKAIRSWLSQLDVDREVQLARKAVDDSRKTKREEAVVRLRYLRGLSDRKIDPKSLMLTQVPILPPVMRPVSRLAGKDTPLIDGMNLLYRDMIEADKNLNSVKGFSSDVSNERLALYDSIQAAVGLREPLDPELRSKQVTGLVKRMVGKAGPKTSFVQRKLLSGTVDMVGRAVIGPSHKIGMDEIGVPEEQAWKLYSMPIIRAFRRDGVPIVKAKQMVDSRDPAAKRKLEEVMSSLPVVASRAPVLHKFGIMAFRPKLVQGHSLLMSPLVYSPFGADNDGDAMNFHVVMGDEAAKEVMEKMLPSKNLFSPRDFKSVNYAPGQDHALGLYLASQMEPDKNSRPQVFRSLADATRAFQRGDISINTPITVLE